MISPWVNGSSAEAFRYHRSLIVVVPETWPMVEDDLGLPLGQFAQVECDRKLGDDLMRDVDGDDPAQSRLIVKMLIRSGLAD